MPQLKVCSAVKTEPGVSETDDIANANEEVENRSNRSTRKLRSRKIVSPASSKKRKPILKTAKQSKRAKTTKSTQRGPRGKHEPLYEERQHMRQNVQGSNQSEASGDVVTSELAQNRSFFTCKLCSKDFSSAFILCLHLQIHEKVGNVPSADEESETAKRTDQSEESLVKKELYQDTTGSLDVSRTDDVNESSTAAPERQPTGILNKNFVENLKKNLSLAMNRQL